MPVEDSSKGRKVLIVAAEASSCLYAQRLLEHWRDQNLEVEAFGIGNGAMTELGFHCLARAEDIAVVGIQEVLSHWGVIKKAFHDVVQAVQDKRPQVVLLLDYPGFNLRLAKRLKALDVPVVYYISPQIWAWRQGRVKVIQKFIHKMLVVFPFEVDFYRRFGVEVEFVGHPLLDEIERGLRSPAERDAHRAKFGIGPSDLVLGLMPGSRHSELDHHLETQLKAAEKLVTEDPKLKVMLFVAPNFTVEQLQTRLSDLKFPLILIKDEPFRMIELADVVLCASGTATLMVGLMGRPMVIMYRMNPFTAFLAKRFVRHTRFFGLINLVLDQLVAPEVFQEEANPDHLAQLLKPLLQDQEKREEMRSLLLGAQSKLGTAGATKRVAGVLASYWSGLS
ncbi:MAG: lipid-A-disaccharide synthase [Bdellovibrionales bacterium]